SGPGTARRSHARHRIQAGPLPEFLLRCCCSAPRFQVIYGHRGRRKLRYNKSLMTAEYSTGSTDSTLRVRYAETDQMGIVYYANYLVWFEIGRTDFCRQHGFAYKDMEKEDGLYIMVAESRCRYKAPA